MKTITLRTRTGRVLRTIEIVRKVSRGLRAHQVGAGCYGRHTLACAIDANGRLYRTTSASTWRECRTPQECAEAVAVLEEADYGDRHAADCACRVCADRDAADCDY